MIRRATAEDVAQVVEIERRHFGASGMPGMFDAQAAAQTIAGIIGRGVVFMSERGAIGGVLAPSIGAPDWLMAVELFWFSEDGQGGALREAFEAWAKEAGASEVRLSAVVHHRGKAVERALRMAGYAPAEVSYVKEVR